MSSNPIADPDFIKFLLSKVPEDLLNSYNAQKSTMATTTENQPTPPPLPTSEPQSPLSGNQATSEEPPTTPGGGLTTSEEDKNEDEGEEEEKEEEKEKEKEKDKTSGNNSSDGQPGVIELEDVMEGVELTGKEKQGAPTTISGESTFRLRFATTDFDKFLSSGYYSCSQGQG